MTEWDFVVLDRELDKTKSRLFMRPRNGFFGPLLCRLDFVWDELSPTADTNGVTIHWNPAFFKRCSLEAREFVLMHEMRHVSGLHVLRRGTRDPILWNYACDYKINYDLWEEGYTWGDLRPLFDKKYANMLEEDIYDLLIGQTLIPLDPFTQEEREEGTGDIAGDCNPEDVLAPVISSAHTAHATGHGDDVGGTEEIIKQLLKPIIPWEVELKEFFEELFVEDYSWLVRDRRYPTMYLPDLAVEEEEGKLCILDYFWDVSGSIFHSDLVRMNSEMKYIFEVFKPDKVRIIQFDTVIQKIDEISIDDEYPEQFKVIGRGGTSFGCVKEYLETSDSKAAVIFSDMDCAPMEPLANGKPVLFVSIGKPPCPILYGRIIYMRKR